MIKAEPDNARAYFERCGAAWRKLASRGCGRPGSIFATAATVVAAFAAVLAALPSPEPLEFAPRERLHVMGPHRLDAMTGV